MMFHIPESIQSAIKSEKIVIHAAWHNISLFIHVYNYMKK